MSTTCNENCSETVLPDGTLISRPSDISNRRDICRECDQVLFRHPSTINTSTKGMTSESKCAVCDCNIALITKLAEKECPIGKWSKSVGSPSRTQIPRQAPVGPTLKTKERIALNNSRLELKSRVAEGQPVVPKTNESKTMKTKDRIALSALIFLIAATVSFAQEVTPEAGGTNSVAEISTSINLRPQTSVFSGLEAWASQGTNFFAFGGAILTGGGNKLSTGAFIGLAYEVSPNLVTVFRGDYLNQAFYQVSLSAQLQLPLHLASWAEFDPFALAGVATPFGGGANNDSVSIQGIAGAGGALRFGKQGSTLSHFFLIGDIEKWSATTGVQYRLGAAAQLGF